jgi:putative FmdB family regulatory protein
MPLYEYECGKCGKRFEVIEKFSDEPLTTHQGCGGEVHRLISTSALQFKGSGWYINDYAKGNANAPDNGAAKKTDSPAASTSDASDSGTTSTPKPSSSSTSTETKSSSTDSKS